MARHTSINTVFKTKGIPTITYVQRENGRFERQLSNAIDEKGTLCLITGLSKTGKTCLYSTVLRQKRLKVLKVSCNDRMSPAHIWAIVGERLGLGQVNGQSVSKKTKSALTAKAGGELGFKLFAGIKGEGSAQTGRESTAIEHKRKAVSEPAPLHLVSLLQKHNYCLVIESINNLQPSVRKTVFQDLKTFVDAEVSTIVVATTHGINDLKVHQTDLPGRITRIELTGWSMNDLSKIVTQGFSYLHVPIVSDNILDIITRGSVGLPIITQAACLDILRKKSSLRFRKLSISQDDVLDALHNVATTSYSDYELVYSDLIRGLREKSRRYNTYEYILTAFSLNPITFSLTRNQLDERIKMIVPAGGMVPPRSSLTYTLNNIENLQNKLDLNVVKWDRNRAILKISDPYFLFYLKWRKKRTSPPEVDDVLEILLDKWNSNK